MAEYDFVMKLGDQLPTITCTLRGGDGVVANLTSCAVAIIYQRVPGGTAARKTATVLSPATAGRVRYQWVGGVTPDITVAGEYRAEWEVTYPDAKVETFPNGGYLTMRVLADLD